MSHKRKIKASLLFFVIRMASAILRNESSLESCSCQDLVKEIKEVFVKSQQGLKYLGDLPVYSATSCKQIHELRPEAKSGMYWIQRSSGPSHVYCQMEGGGCGHGVWMRVANVNMTVSSARCPAGLEKAPTSRSLCRRSVDVGCSSVKFPTFEVSFSKVCGQVIAYQYYSPDAFAPYHGHQTRTIDDQYVDGVSITHSSSPREHIWTFAAGLQEVTHDSTKYSCPCSFTRSYVPFVGTIPEFIGNDYFCETASRTRYSERYYFEDALWDGRGCGRFSTCCRGNKKPWFIKSFAKDISADLEARVCADQPRSNEDVLIEKLLLFVQ